MSNAAPVSKSQLAKNTFLNASAQIFSLASVFIFTPLLVEHFGQLQFGLYTLAASITAYATILDFGVGQSLVREVAKADALNDTGSIKQDIAAAFGLYLIIGVLVALVLAGLAFASEALFEVSVAEGLSLKSLLLVQAVIQLFYWPLVTARQALFGLKDFKTTSTSSIAIVIFTMAAMALTIYIGRGPLVLSALSGAILLAANARNFYVLLRTLSQRSKEPLTRGSLLSAISPRFMKRLAIGSLPLLVVQLTGILMREQTDKVVLGVMLGGVAVAVYEVGAKFSIMLSQIIGLMSSAVLPLASNLESLDDKDSQVNLFKRGSRYIALVVFPIAVVLIVTAPAIIRAWMGDGYTQAAQVMQILIASQIFLPLYVLGDAILTAQKKFNRWIVIAVVVSVVNLVLSILLASQMGITGVALGTLVANFIEFPFFGSYIAIQAGVPVGEWLRLSLLPILPLLIVVGLLGAAVLHFTQIDSMLVLAAVLGAIVLVFWILAYFTILAPWEREQFKSFLSSVRQRFEISK